MKRGDEMLTILLVVNILIFVSTTATAVMIFSGKLNTSDVKIICNKKDEA